MQQALSDSHRQVVAARLRDALEYYRRTNEIFGVLGFSLGTACISTENPSLYGFITAVFLVLAWAQQTYVFKRRLAVLRVLKHDDMRAVRIWPRVWPALIGWFFLAIVAMGMLDKYGLQLRPSVPFCFRVNPASDAHSKPTCAALR